jgi:hypothetical protein
MDNEVELRKFVRQQIFKLYSREHVFSLVVEKFGVPSAFISNQDICGWLSYLDKNSPEEKRIPSEYRLALNVIRREFKKAENLFEQRECPVSVVDFECQLTFLSERYALDVKILDNGEFQLYLYDIFYEQKRLVEF